MDIQPIIYLLSIFILAIFVGYYVVWSVTPALHTPLMSVTNAISSVIIVGALIAVGIGGNIGGGIEGHSEGYVEQVMQGEEAIQGEQAMQGEHVGAAIAARMDKSIILARWLGFFAIVLAAVNIFGGFLVTQRMLSMYRKKDK